MNTAPVQNNAFLRPLLEEAFRAWTEADLPFVVLRNHERLPDFTSNDVDVLVPPDRLGEAEMLLTRAAAATGYRHHHRAEFDPVSLFFHHAETWHQVQVDLFGRLAWRGVPLLETEAVLRRRQSRGTFAIPDPWDEAVLNLLVRLLYQGQVREKYREGIHRAAQNDAATFVRRLAEVLGQAAAAQITGWVLAREWRAIESRAWLWRLRLLAHALRTRPGTTLVGVGQDLRRLWRRWRRPPGLWVVLLGPDGCGKSAVAQELFVSFQPTFQPDKSLLVHWKPMVFPLPHRAARGPTTTPHARPPRSRHMSLLALALHWLEYALGYWMQFRPVLFRNGLVLMDRYHYDFEVDPRRYRLDVDAGRVQRWFRPLPQPDLVFLLDAPTEILRKRKTEVSEDETRRQQAAYRALAARLPQAHLVDASRPLPSVVDTVRQTILQHLLQRLKSAGSA